MYQEEQELAAMVAVGVFVSFTVVALVAAGGWIVWHLVMR